jgi:hypothetical protein
VKDQAVMARPKVKRVTGVRQNDRTLSAELTSNPGASATDCFRPLSAGARESATPGSAERPRGSGLPERGMHSQPKMGHQVSRYQRHSHRAKRQAGNNYAHGDSTIGAEQWNSWQTKIARGTSPFDFPQLFRRLLNSVTNEADGPSE